LLAVPFSSDATVPAASAAKHPVILRGYSGVTFAATSLGCTNANPASSSAGTRHCGGWLSSPATGVYRARLVEPYSLTVTHSDTMTFKQTLRELP
jgi:hypothetical protein